MDTDIRGDGKKAINWRIVGWSGAALLLTVPLIAMQYSDEVVWTGSDFVFAGTMFLVAGILFELGVRASGSLAYRFGVAVAIAAGFLTIWVNAAVAIFADEGPHNLIFFIVVLIALAASAVARFRAAGMARAMVVAAFAQAVAAVGGWAAGFASPGTEGVRELCLAIGLFGGLWLLSAWLFRKAAA